MLAIWNKGSMWSRGRNRLGRRAHTIDSSYPNILGQHAELDLFRTNPDMRGGTVWVAGCHERSGSTLDRTRPCMYCASILSAANVRFVVYFENGTPTKCSPRSLIK